MTLLFRKLDRCIKLLFTFALDFVAPKKCCFCDGTISKTDSECRMCDDGTTADCKRDDCRCKDRYRGFVCDSCLSRIKFINQDTCCKRCGYPIERSSFLDRIIICPSCESGQRFFNIARSAVQYKMLTRKVLLNMKYYYQTECLPFIGETMIDIYKNIPRADIICFVPVSRMKLFCKGFNHAGLIANTFYDKLLQKLKESNRYFNNNRSHNKVQNKDINEEGEDDIDRPFFVRDLLAKPKDTIQSKRLSRYERMIKKNSFIVSSKYLSEFWRERFKGKTFLVIDDIMTTGATLNSISKLLKETFPNCNVECLTFARTMLY